MLDALLSLVGQLHKPIFDEKYHADQAIVKASLMEIAGSTKLTVVFLPWHIPEWFENYIAKRLKKAGSNVLIYHFNPAILEADAITVKDSFEYIALSVAVDIRQLRLLKGFKVVDLLGISLGNVALCITAEKLESFNDVYLIVPGSSLADSLWLGWRTRRLRNHLRQAGVRLDELEKEWKDLAPDAHIEILKTHPIHIVLARRDKFIPYLLGERLTDSLVHIDPHVTVSRRPLGHIATILTSATSA